MANVDIRLPNITGTDPATQMAQMQSYLYQMVQQLNWALNTLDSTSSESNNLVITKSNGTEISASDAHAQATFDEIKSLIIKSADIVNAYYESMSETLHGEFVAESDFGTYREQTQQQIEKNSTDIQQNFTNIQTLTTDVEAASSSASIAQETADHAKEKADSANNNANNAYEKADSALTATNNLRTDVNNLREKIIKTDAWIKSGELETKEDGTKIYGVEVGQINTVDGVETFNKYARFTADGIYFYLPGYKDPVSWMTGSKLYITNAEIIGNLTLGKYILDTSSGIAFKWVGGAS